MDELMTKQRKGLQKKLKAVTGENFPQNALKRKQVTAGDYDLLPDIIFRG